VVRVAGVGSTRPVASVHVNVMGKVPVVGKVMSPGFCAVVGGATPLKFQAKVKGWSPSASTQCPCNVTDVLGGMIRSAPGESITLRGGVFVVARSAWAAARAPTTPNPKLLS